MSIDGIPDRELYMKYIGVLAVLGLVSSRSIPEGDRESIDLAFEDANVLLAARKRGIKFVRAAAGGWAPVETKGEE